MVFKTSAVINSFELFLSNFYYLYIPQYYQYWD